MKKLIVFMFFIALAGCESDVNASKNFKLKCGSYDVAIDVLDADTLQTAVNGEKITMNRANSASDDVRRYEGRGAVVSISLRLKGNNIWSLNIDNSGQISCVAAVKK